MGLGDRNRIVGKMQAQTQITGDTVDNVVVGTRFTLDHKARMIGARCSISAMAGSKTSAISVFVDASADYKVVNQFGDMIDSVLVGKMVLTAAYKTRVYAAGTVFYMKEQCAASANVNGLSVDLYFRSEEA